MELLKSLIVFAGGVFILVVIIALTVLVTCFIKMLFIGLSELNNIDKDDPETCGHENVMYDDGHPDNPWKCNNCGKRITN